MDYISRFDYYHKCFCEHSTTYVLAFLSGVYLGMELLRVGVCMCFALVDTAK